MENIEPPSRSSTYVFGPFRFDIHERSLIRDGRSIRLTAKSADLLSALIQNAGRLVTKEQLIQLVWPETFVVESNLTFYVFRLRKALGDNTESPTYIETAAGRGYRFICPVRLVDANFAADSALAGPIAPVAGASAVNEPQTLPRRRWRWAVLATVLTLAALVAFVIIHTRATPMPRVLRIARLTHDGKAKAGLLLVDGSRLLFKDAADKQYELRLDTGTILRLPNLDPYGLLDVSAIRNEALAIRPQDRGAEDALWAVRLDGSASRRIGMVVIAHHAAAWSHDGKRIAYGDGHTLYVTDSDGALSRAVTSFTGWLITIRWAPDDRFLRVDVSEAMARTSRLTQYDVRLDTAKAHRTVTSSSFDACCGAWLPDSTDYVFAGKSEAEPKIWMLREQRGLFGNRRPLLQALTSQSSGTPYADPVSSSDGMTIYTVLRGDEQLVTYDDAQRAFAPYLNGISAFAVSFSPPDRRSVGYIKKSDNTLWRANADGTQPLQLTFSPWNVDAFAWSPHGRRLAVRAKEPGRRAKIYLLSAEGGMPEPLENSDVEQGDPTWSPDGRQIAFGDVPETYGRATGTECIHIYDLLTRTTIDVPGSGGLWSGRWSPDGRYIAATRISDRTLMLYDVISKTWRDLGLQHVGELTWLDRTTISAELEPSTRSVVRVHVPDGHVESTIDVADESLHSGAGVTPDGRPLFLRAATDIFALQLERR